MSKLSFKKDIQEFERNGGSMSFTFGETKLPVIYVIYREALNLLCVKMPTTEVFIPVDYRLDFSDNANLLMEKLLQKYPELQE